MKKRSWLFSALAFLGGFLAVQAWYAHQNFAAKDREAGAEELVEEFGRRLQLVPLMGAPEVGSAAIREQYGPLVDAALVERWAMSPLDAPGRLAPTPYPDRIEVDAVIPQEDGSFAVRGQVVEETAAGESGRIPFSAVVANLGKQQVIVAFESSREEGQKAN